MRRTLLTAVAVLALLGAGCAPSAAPSATPAPAEATPAASGPDCRQHEHKVSIRPAEPANHRVVAWLCAAGEPKAEDPVQVLLHGGTYDHSYWDWPGHSYVAAATQRGYVTLNVDRLGYGRSDRPDPQLLDSEAHGWVIHQLVRGLRDGAFGPRFRTVVLNGHSMGGIAAKRAAAHGAVDALVISGIPADPPAHGPTGATQDDDAEGGPPDSALPFYPADQDPAFAGRPWAAGYLTTRPGVRAELFLHAGDYDPQVAAQDEERKDTVPSAELAGVANDTEGVSAPATVPTLSVLGRYDALICRVTRDCRTDPVAAGARLVERSGHSINLGHGANDFYQLTFDWLREQGIG